jgi:glycosyltransferase involved in cell wall biosynthesis
MTTIAFILVSWRPDAPAGMERAVAAHAAGLVANGHHPVIITADPSAPATYRGAKVVTLNAINGLFPCDDNALRDAIDGASAALAGELTAAFDRHYVDIAIYVDALWGLGRIMPQHQHARNVLAAHVVGHDIDLTNALTRNPKLVIAPSRTVLDQGAARGLDTTRWKVVPNALLNEAPVQPEQDRDRLRHHGPVRILARLGPEKGVTELIDAHIHPGRPVEIALADAAFEDTAGSQHALLQQCRLLASGKPEVTVTSVLAWDDVPAWLGAAAVVIVPSLAETFGLVALEAMAMGTPVVAYDIGNLPALVGDGGVLVPYGHGPGALWRAARQLMTDPVQYRRTSRAAYYRSRDYWPALVADQLLKVVS